MISDPAHHVGIKNEIRHAPEVHYFAGRSRLNAVIVCFAYAVGALQLVGWALSGVLLGIGYLIAVLTLHCCFAFAIIHARKSSRCAIRWSPADLAWHVEDSTSSATGSIEIRRLSVCLDTFDCILLKIEGWSGAGRWLWLDRASDPSEWKSIRRALYSPANTRLFQGR